jgi:hypothetical protein
MREVPPPDFPDRGNPGEFGLDAAPAYAGDAGNGATLDNVSVTISRASTLPTWRQVTRKE